MIDLSDRIIQPSAPARKPSDVRWHPWRRALQLVCGVLLVALPLTDGLRADVRAGTFYVAWHKMALHDTMALFWLGMLAFWALMAVSFLYGRVWCGWVCPQTLASDFAESIQRRLDRAFRARPGRPSYAVSRAVWTAAMLATSWGTAIVLTWYWLSPSAVGYAALHPFNDIPAALAIYSLTALLAWDLLWLRRKFCANACPYGAFLGVLADKNTLAVRYLDERDDDCIRCGACVTSCPMGIDIKDGVGQYACIGCGECVDACNDVLGKRGVLGLIEYRYGLEPERQTRALPWRQKLGLWDNRRLGVLATLVAFLVIVAVTMSIHLPVSASAMADGAITESGGRVLNSYTLTVSNGAPDRHAFKITVRGLSQGVVVAPAGAVFVDGHSQSSFPLTLSAPRDVVKPGVPMPVTVDITTPGEHTETPLVFYLPVKAGR